MPDVSPSTEIPDTLRNLHRAAKLWVRYPGKARSISIEVRRRGLRSPDRRGAGLLCGRAELLAATVARLVQMDARAVWQDATTLSAITHPAKRAIRTLANAFAHPSFAAELELWAMARTDAALRQSLRFVECDARESRDRVLRQAFAPVAESPRVDRLTERSPENIRGLILSPILRRDLSRREGLIRTWIQVARQVLDASRRRGLNEANRAMPAASCRPGAVCGSPVQGWLRGWPSSDSIRCMPPEGADGTETFFA